MAAGLPSKAKRGKRRWIGLAVHISIDTRKKLESSLSEMEGLPGGWRLYDFVKAESQDCNLAIICVKLSDYSSSKEALSDLKAEGDAASIRSLTSSGKIRLVRDRLGLKKPKRQRSR